MQSPFAFGEGRESAAERTQPMRLFKKPSGNGEKAV